MKKEQKNIVISNVIKLYNKELFYDILLLYKFYFY